MNRYFAIRAIDGANNTGRISNIVTARISEPTTARTPDQTEYADDFQRVMMSTVMPDMVSSVTEEDYDSWRVYGAALVGAVSLVMLAIVVFACFICVRKNRLRASKDPERPIYKIYVNNAYIQEEDGEIKVVSKEKTLNEKDSTQVSTYVYFKFTNELLTPSGNRCDSRHRKKKDNKKLIGNG